jgi:hypothetical protein
MRDELADKLRQAAPLLYRNTDVHQYHLGTNPPFNFECGDGWFELLKDASVRIEALLKQSLIEGASIDDLTRAVQVKEKFGTLRFYVDSATDEVHAIISEAENLSEVTCEQCGARGRMRGKRWYYTACNECTDLNDLDAP